MPESPIAIFALIELAAVAVFACTGALAASRKDMDAFGYIVLGLVTGIGGGSLRDVILGRQPLFWITDMSYLVVCVAAAILVAFMHAAVTSRQTLILWLDAIGLSMFCVTGASIALAAGIPPVGAVVLGIITATFGGLIRDVLSSEIPLILKQEIYVTAALLGSAIYVALVHFAVPEAWAAASGFVACFLLRGLAIQYGWQLPPVGPRR